MLKSGWDLSIFYRDTKVVNPENCKLRYFPPQKEENWENEIQDSTLTNGETMCFGVKPYGKENLLKPSVALIPYTVSCIFVNFLLWLILV